jgi:hypothetical protein
LTGLTADGGVHNSASEKHAAKFISLPNFGYAAPDVSELSFALSAAAAKHVSSRSFEIGVPGSERTHESFRKKKAAVHFPLTPLSVIQELC